jgi:hypothetical protein
MKMLVGNPDDQTATDPSLLRIIARAHDIQARLVQNTKLTVHDVARDERVSAAYIYNLLRLPWLAPTMQLTEPRAGSDVGALRTRAERGGRQHLPHRRAKDFHHLRRLPRRQASFAPTTRKGTP